MDIIEALTSRRCVRHFLSKPVDNEIIHQILATARHAPSGVNSQPWRVVVVTHKAKHRLSTAIIEAFQAGIRPTPDYQYYPTTWFDPYKERRKQCGAALYQALDIGFEEKDKRQKAWEQNYRFFDAPVGLLFFVDKRLEKGSWVDMGMFIQSVMLCARHFNLDTCPQASLAEYPDIVRKHTDISADYALICGVSLGYADSQATVNQYRLERVAVDAFTSWMA